jgi:triphosphoribosyl-dephospho-CoA synthase
MTFAESKKHGLTLSQCVTLSAIMEATAAKPGNVHRGADFEDITYADFILAAVAIGPIVGDESGSPLGDRVLRAVEATREWIGTNANLGIILLCSPLAMVPRDQPIRIGVEHVLGGLTADDAAKVYQAIRLAKPGGLGSSSGADVHATAPTDLVAAMRLAADRDMVARQYAENFRNVLDVVVPWLQDAIATEVNLSRAIVRTHLRLMAEYPDSLIGRKLGPDLAQQSAARAKKALDAGASSSPEYQQELADFDFWLRSDGHRRNPGTTADLIAAGLFVLLREGLIQPPFRLADWSHD